MGPGWHRGATRGDAGRERQGEERCMTAAHPARRAHHDGEAPAVGER